MPQLSIVHGYRDSSGKPRQKIIRPLGYLDVLQKEYDDLIHYFEEVVRQMTANHKNSNSPQLLEIDPVTAIVIVECGFFSNWKEAALLNAEEYQDRLAFTIHMGIMEYLNER